MKRFDERDTIFSRMSLQKNSDGYKSYYANNPEKKDIDDQTRKMPGLLTNNSRQFNPILSPMANSAFKFLNDIKPLAEKRATGKKVEISANEASTIIKKYARYYGADLVGISEINKDFYYSHRGRKPHYGEKIKDTNKYAVVFGVEMDKEMINRAPKTEECIEVTKGYVKAALIGMMLSYYIRDLGYPARNHMDGNYLLIAPPVAAETGLGEIGKSGLLVTKNYGPRVRIGMVSTDLTLIPDKADSFGLKEFCDICNNCVRLCPAKAISSVDDEHNSRLHHKYIDADKCYQMWRKLGTDCGICLASCPFSHNIESELLNSMKEDTKVKKKIWKQYSKKYKTRPVNKDSYFNTSSNVNSDNTG